MPTPLCFLGGRFIPLEEAKVGVMTHALHYGTAVFEGIRANWNEEEGTANIFRLREHYQRFLSGCQLLKMKLPYSIDDLCRITLELVEKCDYRQDSYIRPLAFKSAQRVANLKLQDLEDDFLVFMIPFGAYLDVNAAARCCTSSWRRIDDTMIPPRFKISGLYVNSVLAKTEATLSGFDEAIMLNTDGHVSEGTGENIFLVKGGKLVTPPASDNILEGITRNTVMEIAHRELGIATVERSVDRSELYTADECFLTGTAAHLTPVGEIDHRPIGDGKMGATTRQLQDLYFDAIRGKKAAYRHWCSAVSLKPVKA
ncbi:MAG: branched-chain amino acid transaminase [Dehalococcoidia bacterium]|nr:branched-chain amino acid transaminase [Dehalococcoidia bacterium]